MTFSSPEEYLAALAQIRDAAQQRAFISEAPVSPSEALVEQLSTKIREIFPKDLSLAETLVETNLHLASIVNTPIGWAWAIRSRAQVLSSMKKSAEAQPHFERAAELFKQAGVIGEYGRTLVVALDNLMYLSRYDQAIELGARAREALEQANDTQYMPTLDIALGNLYYRLNRYAEALAHYDNAQKALQSTENYISQAAVGLNRAHVLTDMNRFDEALRSFETTKQHCEQHDMAMWAAIADRGISQMHFSRGNYSSALRMLEQVRKRHDELNDVRRVGLCDMDRAEIYLQLNLFDDAAKLAGRAFEIFERLANNYEAAKCLTFQGISEFKLLNDKDAAEAFQKAREIFIKEGNELWVAVVDLWRAQLLIRQQQFSKAQELAQHSAEIFEKQQVPVRAANARVLSAQSWQELNDKAAALAEAQKALGELEGFHAPWVSYQCYHTLGRLKELDGNVDEAQELYLKAIADMESLRGNIRLDEMRMSFGRDKYQVYENVVNLKLAKGEMSEAFDFVERSKSRTLIDLLERNLETMWDAGTEESPRLLEIRKIREELNILYTRLNEVGATARAALSDNTTKDAIIKREEQLIELLRGIGSERSGWTTLQTMPLAGVKETQQMMQPDEVLIEYYAVGDRFHAFVVGSNDFNVVKDLTTTANVRASLKGITFQLSKFHLQPAYVLHRGGMLLKAIQHHLTELHRQLIEPLRALIGTRSLVIVPHNMLHYIPFQALYDGTNYLIDTHDIVYSASASVLKICRERRVPKTDKDLVLAVADELTPYIHEEVAALKELLPNARVFTGQDATEDKLRQYGSSAGKIHIAAHGIFRADNPMFSALRLGDTWLNLFDIFNLQLGSDLTTLSACETGMSAVWEGDELLGLARGFLYAGTPSLVVSLWTVNDRSTAQLMRRFYEGLQKGLTKPRALREAMIEVKSVFPHPYYWAPFVLMGKS